MSHTHLSLEESHLRCSVATCGRWAPSWGHQSVHGEARAWQRPPRAGGQCRGISESSWCQECFSTIPNSHAVRFHSHSFKHKRCILRHTKAINWYQAIRRELHVNLFLYAQRSSPGLRTRKVSFLRQNKVCTCVTRKLSLNL